MNNRHSNPWSGVEHVRLYRCRERQVGVWLPIPLSARLDYLVERGNEYWAPTRRKEVVSGLILATSCGPRDLRAIVQQYRQAGVEDAVVDGTELWRYLYPPTSPGPRTQVSLFPDLDPPEDPPSVRPDETLKDAKTYRTGMMVAAPLADRLKGLIAIAKSSGTPTTGQELLSAIVLAAPTAGPILARLLARYWHGTIGDALIADCQPSASARRRRRHIRPT